MTTPTLREAAQKAVDTFDSDYDSMYQAFLALKKTISDLRDELRGRTQNFDDACATIARLEQTNSAALDKAEQERDKALAELAALRQERGAARAEVNKLRALLLEAHNIWPKDVHVELWKRIDAALAGEKK
jgi:uncharacterized protein YukE